jgi:hypothetical protein
MVRSMFIPILPFMLILSALGFVLMYHQTLGESVQAVRSTSVKFYTMSTEDILKSATFDAVPFSVPLELYYMGIFITAESAFIVMAIKEYLQHLVGLSGFEILTGAPLKDGVKPEDARWATKTMTWPQPTAVPSAAPAMQTDSESTV